jgi:serine protease
MPGIARLLATLIVGCAVLSLAPATAAVPEWNSVRTHALQLGPEASRLLVGFRATPSNALVKTIKARMHAQGIKIVQASTSDADVAGLAMRTGFALARSRQITPSMHVLYLQKTIYGASVHALLKKLRADPAVQFADVDQRRYVHAMPDDPLFGPTTGASGQWYMQTPSSTIFMLGGVATEDLSATDAISAWTITTGSTGTVIADIDTGVRFDHPDLLRAGFGGRLLPGYDFVDQDLDAKTGAPLGTFLIANDGDGWDPDPSDPGDWISSTDLMNSLFPPSSCGNPPGTSNPSDSSWHGTRVTGVLGALTNNGVGIAGMTWNPYQLPVRALGKCGGYDSDIIAGIEWAVGMSVTDSSGNAVPDNPYPADIINLSLGGSGNCSDPYVSELPIIIKMGVLIVASAGNGGTPGTTAPVEAPGNCPGVLAVVGLRNVGTKVGYSSFGPEAGIAAPAGNCVTTSGPCYRSIDTTYNTGLTVPGANSYTDQTSPNLGTSFSAPIVSGIAALMRAVNANLTPPQLISRIQSSATPFPQPAGLLVCPANDATSGECACPNTGTLQCGTGMVNALSAVQAAQRPIAAVAIPSPLTAGSPAVFNAGGSVAACNVGVTPNVPLSVASYSWSNTGGVTIQSGAGTAQATILWNGAAGTLTLTVKDSANNTDQATVTFTTSGATSSAPSTAGTAATACPTPMTVTPVAPTVTEAFSPTSVNANVASTLTITFNNTNGFALTQSGFTETVPANLTVETSPAPTTTCAGANGTLTSSASAVTMAGANIPAKGSCTMTLSVMSATAGTYTNSIAANALTTGPAPSSTGTASTSLTVTGPAASKGGGGGDFDWLDMMFVAGVLLAGRRQLRPHAPRP